MTRNLKTLGLALLAVFALGAIGAQAASAALEHEFHADGERAIFTGKNVGAHTFQVGAAGTVECTSATFEGTVVGTFVSEKTYKSDRLTVKPTYTGCTFGGQPATVKFNRCDYTFDSDTTEQAETSTPGAHANVFLRCRKNNKIEIHTVNCTITVGGTEADPFPGAEEGDLTQPILHSVRYANVTSSSIEVKATAHKIVVGKERNTAAQPANGCLVFPTGAVGKYTGNATVDCRKDEDVAPQADPTTPGATQDSTTTDCTVTDV